MNGSDGMKKEMQIFNLRKGFGENEEKQRQLSKEIYEDQKIRHLGGN